jgi:hypothetical protein
MSVVESVLFLVNLWFAIETELSTANQRSLQKMLFYSEFVIRYRNLVVCNKLAFTIEVELFCSESAFAAESVLTASKLWFTTEIELPAAK